MLKFSVYLNRRVFVMDIFVIEVLLYLGSRMVVRACCTGGGRAYLYFFCALYFAFSYIFFTHPLLFPSSSSFSLILFCFPHLFFSSSSFSLILFFFPSSSFSPHPLLFLSSSSFSLSFFFFSSSSSFSLFPYIH